MAHAPICTFFYTMLKYTYIANIDSLQYVHLSLSDGCPLVVHVLLWRVLDDESGQSVPHVHLKVVATSLARSHDVLLFDEDLQHRLRVVTFLAQHESGTGRVAIQSIITVG